MKILYVISSTELGGAEKMLAELVSAISPMNQVRVICLKPLGEISVLLQKAGAEVLSLAEGSALGGKIHQLSVIIREWKPDIVHAMLLRAILYTRIACAGKNVKLITTPHFDLSKRHFIFQILDRLLKETDTFTVAESASTARYLIEHQGYRKEKVLLFPNSADNKCFYKDETIREQMRQKHGFHVKTVVFICVARLAYVKDPLTLLKAFRNVYRSNPDIRLVYVGEGAERENMEFFIEQSGLKDVVLLAGVQSNINDWLNMADVFVLPSIEESLPLSLLEALKVGLPCMVSKVGDMPLWVIHGENGFVFPAQDITLLSCLLETIAKDAHKREQMGKSSLEISKRINPSSPQYQQLYQQVIQ